MLFVALALVAAAPDPASQTTQAQVVPEVNRKPLLDKMLASHDRAGLARVLNSPPSPAALVEGLNWQREKMVGGTTTWVTLHYAVELWKIGDARKDDGVKQTAAYAFLYTVAATATDGNRCKDSSAPPTRMNQIVSTGQPIIDYIRAAPAETRRKIIDAAIKLETKTSASPDRIRDWYLCSGGKAEVQYGMKRGKPKPVPTAPGQFGNAVALDTRGYRPEFLPEAASTKAVAQARAKLPANLSKVSGL